ncbi:UNVERIFIED_CONTAM: NADPH-dependent aldehyde reductase-like protein, chloroplastic [Sesamum latifolium]|uniref:NADPH-dependent aldehyde reductase-like protein, chloroplastic n=1 Tax=Sesamum latifolium TaxID=2727402 RepID=A0AAW2VLK2_9LAMI
MGESSTHPLPLPLQDRVAVVTGASRGIGRAVALHLASLGAKLLINYASNSAEAHSVASQINTPPLSAPSPFKPISPNPTRIKRGGGGRIICLTTSLVASLKPGYGAYTASKAAVEAMVKILAKELKGTGITANAVAPGPVATEMFYAGKTEEMVKKAVEESPLGRLGETDDVTPVVGFLASDAGEWVNGQIIRVNGGYV